MAVYGGPEVVSDGLVLCLDAGNSRSYPGSGTVWTDLSGRNNVSTITNSPVYSSSNGGYFNFDGVDDYVEIQNSSSISPTSEITVSCWCRVTAASGTMIRRNGNDYLLEWNPETNKLEWYLFTSSGAYFIYSSLGLSFNVWYNTLVNYKAGVGGNMYLNGSILPTTVGATELGNLNQSNSYLRVGNYGGETFQGSIAQVSIYNRALSAAEVAQNYAATRGRFGL
jgi:hypothetical protein